jgi:hypothetical protein
MAKTKWGVVYNADALSLYDMLHFAPLAEQAGADSIWTGRHGVTLSFLSPPWRARSKPCGSGRALPRWHGLRF